MEKSKRRMPHCIANESYLIRNKYNFYRKSSVFTLTFNNVGAMINLVIGRGCAILIVYFPMWQTQMRKMERRKRRRRRFSVNRISGHTMKNCMTVISRMGCYQILNLPTL